MYDITDSRAFTATVQRKHGHGTLKPQTQDSGHTGSLSSKDYRLIVEEQPTISTKNTGQLGVLHMFYIKTGRVICAMGYMNFLPLQKYT